jgi:branched-subunit amino acid transport protein
MAVIGGIEGIIAVVGLTALTVLTRGFFFLSRRELPLPAWLAEGLKYAPLAALTGVIAPELLMTQGHLIDAWRDARLFGATAGALWFWWRRGLLGTMSAGMAVYLPLRLVMGW